MNSVNRTVITEIIIAGILLNPKYINTSDNISLTHAMAARKIMIMKVI